ncbi:MAG: NADH-quinone oxidoreductase subunit C [Bdellovibrionales bacterium]|nr:NADH-quinone oxidoreductase subunit C [Bdellovibrionales bacterium]
MSDTSWVEGFKTKFAGSLLSVRESAPGEPEFTVRPVDVVRVLEALKNLEGGGFDHLADLTGYDAHPASPRFHAVYELISMRRKMRVSVICPIEDNEKPSIASVTSLWSGANWLERETFDMLGIHFVGHPDERRILLPDAFVGHPLRKDFISDYRQKFPQTIDKGLFDPFGNTVVNVEKI